jgi:hypothetical protein
MRRGTEKGGEGTRAKVRHRDSGGVSGTPESRNCGTADRTPETGPQRRKVRGASHAALEAVGVATLAACCWVESCHCWLRSGLVSVLMVLVARRRVARGKRPPAVGGQALGRRGRSGVACGPQPSGTVMALAGPPLPQGLVTTDSEGVTGGGHVTTDSKWVRKGRVIRRKNVSLQSENVRVVQSRNVRFSGGPEGPWRSGSH